MRARTHHADDGSEQRNHISQVSAPGGPSVLQSEAPIGSNSALCAPTQSGASGLFLRGPFPFPLAQNASSAASHTCRRPAARRLLLRAAVTTEHGHLGRSNGASQRLGRASFTHAATTNLSGPGVEPWCELHVRGGCGHSRSTRRTSTLAVGVLSWRERETAAEDPSAVAIQRLPGSPSGSPCPF